MHDTISICFPCEWLGDNYNEVKTKLIKGYDLFSFEMKRDSLKIHISIVCRNIEKTLEFLCDNIFIDSQVVENTHSVTLTYLCAKNYLLARILHFKNFNEILEEYKCKILTSYIDQNFSVTISGKSREGVNRCKRLIEELYFSNILMSGLDLPAEKIAIILGNSNKIVLKDKRSVIFGVANELEKLEEASKCTISLMVNEEIGNFICGKKMGKIVKINSRCVTVEKNEGKMNFRMNGPIKECLRCYKELFDEFPFEMCFSVDRKHHKKIIGFEGTVIQSIMKRFNFYVKFLSAKEMHQMNLEGNVILKTPRKNREGLKEVKQLILKQTLKEEVVFKGPSEEKSANSGKVGEKIQSSAETSEYKKISTVAMNGKEEGISSIPIELEGFSFEGIRNFIEMNIRKEKWY
ncbi:hypothetical protein GINT2_001725 [Glugoides intestinalis]